MKTKEEIRKHLFDLVSDSISNFFYYDRKEDDILGPDDFDKYEALGYFTVKEIADEFYKRINIPKKEMVKLKIFSTENPKDYEIIEVSKDFYDKYNGVIDTNLYEDN